MAYQSIGLGTTEGDGTGDTLRVGGDYRSQEFPNGSAATITTYNLRITKA